MSMRILKTPNIWLDVIFIIGNILILYYFIEIKSNGKIKATYEEASSIIYFREAEVICVISIYFKGMGYLRLSDSIAPLLDTA